ncbi:MAG: hypothetical protein VYA70_03035 [Gemmatimonadota bacterium]|nr:hypothetical protein [Gemmatimonadota bacterium]MEC7846350.1 hypothetical protein [Gemmatimonadota bacterium]|tara:strand:- start:141 stop:713 length:573 start_codon:yes stop_codon:yes gene_type:complete
MNIDFENIDRKAVIRTSLRVVAVLILIPVVALGALMVSARFSDGPSAVFRGGPLVAGELVTGPEPDWSFARDVREIELQLLDPPQSRLIWIAEYEGRIFVVSGYMNSFLGGLWKKWPAQAERDGRAILRIDGKRYERQLVRIKTGYVVEGVTAEFSRKYRAGMTPAAIESENTWLFELAPRGPGMSGASR